MGKIVGAGTGVLGAVVLGSISDEAVRIYREEGIYRSDRNWSGPSVQCLPDTDDGPSYRIGSVVVSIDAKTRSTFQTSDNSNDTLRGTEYSDRLIGLGGNDTLYGLTNRDALRGGNGGDKLYGGAGDDALIGENGNDLLAGSGDEDRLYGGTGNDKVFGDAGMDRLYGGDGADLLEGGLSRDTLYGALATIPSVARSTMIICRATPDQIFILEVRGVPFSFLGIRAAAEIWMLRTSYPEATSTF